DAPVGIDMLELVTYERRIVGSAYGSITPQRLVPRILRLYLEGKIVLDDLVSERLPLEQINAAFHHSRHAEGMRPVLRPSPDDAW
ncbi:MAG: S-(hydroxymethyl)glutathione dehydrogenase / alcohol dehydrogenase, partial [Gaiellales bacterium]|nr:S-(hydroxymethyl)glutathione dehydrogenase / alcohol dehydrogenase [Gaiellales bacterium]